MSSLRFSPLQLLKKLLVGLFSVIFVVLLTVWLASYYLIPWQINEQLKPFQLALSKQTSIGFNPFVLQLKVENLSVLTHRPKQSQEQHQEQTVAELKHAEIDVSWQALLKQQINLESLQIEGIELLVQREQERIVIAGLDLTELTELSSNSETNTAEQQNSEQGNQQSGLQAWQFVMANANIANVVINIDDLGHQHQFTLEQLAIRDVLASLISQQGKLDLTAKLNSSTISIALSADAQSSSAESSDVKASNISVESTLDLKQFSLADFAYYMEQVPEQPVKSLAGSLDIHAVQTLVLGEQGWQVNQDSFSLALKQLATRALGYQIEQESLLLTLKDGVYQEQDSENSGLSVQANLELNTEQLSVYVASSNTQRDNVRSEPEPKPATLAALDALKIKDGKLSYNSSATLTELTLAQIQLEKILFSEPSESSEQAGKTLFKANQLTVDNVSLQNSHLAIEEIALSTFDSHIWLDKNKQLANLVLPTQAASDKEPHLVKELVEEQNSESEQTPVQTHTETEPQQLSEQSQITFSLAKFSLLEPSQLYIQDQSVNPVFEHQLSISEIQLTDINSQTPEQVSRYAVAFNLDQFSGARIDGDIMPFAEQLNLNTVVKISEFSLPDLSSYMRDALGFDFLAGQLDSDIEVKVVNDEIDGEVKIALRGFELSSDNDVSGEHVKESSAIPLNAALGMLKDSDGNLHLDIPLSGNVNDPQFGVSSFVTLIAKKAVMAQAENYLINTFVPYANVVTVARVAGKYLLKVKVEDLLYQPGQIDLDQAQQSFIDELAKLLQDREKQRVTMCSVAVATDLSAEQEQLPEPERVKTLQTISEQRAQQLKASLVEQYQIASSRLLLCEPKVDLAEGAKPRVEFSF
ncbi:DUF748 domain-containing protein [Endozoicomonas sp. G2_1]|uniref:DUF748 domain-containing protein n=1 Tax=Endozoicomonas sp. G2_1 TaxID=2821091 RepID=UPI001ADB001F|nr:DUF748 domain-containing protein [Endozoicomonas sp. G2_1]MBO9489443.1 DUF748 domain-containing protein [Endozoicomonas sp. G2_1]